MPWELVALGTVADCVPLRGDRRRLVRHGLFGLARTPSCGLRALAQVSGILRLHTASQVTFLLAPRLNAAGRLANPNSASELLLTTDPASGERIARHLDQTNRQRPQLAGQVQTVLEVIGRQSPEEREFAVVADASDLHFGVLRIVAA